MESESAMPRPVGAMYSRGIGAAGDLADELEALAGIGLDLELDVAVLAVAAGLADEATGAVRLRGDRLAVRHLGLADGGVDLEFAQHAVDDDLEVELAHPRDDRLAGLLVGANAEGGVLLGELLEGDAHLVLLGLGLGLDGDRDDRLREA